MTVEYTGHLADCPLQVVVDDDVSGDGPAQSFLVASRFEAAADVIGRIAPFFQSTPEFGHRRWDHEDQHCAGNPGQHLLCPLKFNLEHDITAGRRFRHGRSVEMAEKLGPFQEAAGLNARLELLAGGERVRVGWLPRPT